MSTIPNPVSNQTVHQTTTALRLLLPLVKDGERERLRQHAIEAARATQSPEILAALIEPLSMAERPSIIAAALETAQARSGVRRAEALVAIAPHTSEPQRTALFTEALSVCLGIVNYDGMADQHGRVLALAQLASTLPTPIAVRALDEVIAMAHAISRNLSLYALASFAPTLANLEGVEGIRTVVRAVCETAAWFPFEIQGAIMLGVMSVQL